MAPSTWSRAKPAGERSTVPTAKEASGEKSKRAMGDKPAGKRKTLPSPPGSDDEDQRPPKKKAVVDFAPASARTAQSGPTSSAQQPTSKTANLPRSKPKSVLEAQIVKPPATKASGSGATSAKSTSAPVRQMLDFVQVPPPPTHSIQPARPTTHSANRTPSPADSDKDMGEDSIDEEARRQELARVTRQKLAQAAAKKRLAAISARYGKDSGDDDSDGDIDGRLKVSTPIRTYGKKTDATWPSMPQRSNAGPMPSQRDMEPSQVVQKGMRKIINGEIPQLPAAEQGAHQAESKREGEDAAGNTGQANLNLEHNDDSDNEEHFNDAHIDYSSTPCGHALSEPYEESEHERDRNNDPPSDYNDNENTDVQSEGEGPRRRKNKGKERARDPQSDHGDNEAADVQHAKPRRRKNKGKGKKRARKPRAGKPVSDDNDKEDGGAKPGSRKDQNKGKQVDDDSASNYEHSVRDSSDDDSLADAMASDDDNDLANASINPQRLRRMLAAEEVKLTLINDNEEDSGDDDNEEEHVFEPVRGQTAKMSKAVLKLRAEEPLVNVEDDENNAVAARIKARSASTGPAHAGPSRAGPSRAGPSRAGPLRAGPSHAGPSRAGRFDGEPASDASSAHDVMLAEVDPTASVPLFSLVYGRKGKIKITRLNPRLRRVIKLSYIVLENDIYTIDAFPDTLKHNKLVFLYISQNTDWTREVISLLETRLSQLRGYVRALAIAKVASHYKLSNNPPDLDLRIEELLKGMRYIFSGNILTGYDATKPFRHPCLSDIISLLLFKHRATFLEAKPDFFDDVWQGAVYKMVPGPLICLAATAIHSVIRDLGSPENDIWDFSSKKYSDVYTSHHNAMIALSDRLSGAVEFLLHATYDDASNERTCKPKHVIESSLEYMDVDHMEVL
ncbi:hypothetical protein PsYK624_028590 [Phanerochaete sordida]|uniref:DUF6532 domain-containing protein n=1 Tax=Phanerochaete sordida TaxID=48140 RepID=A0A9P3G284_9APHY|nr:hypothetical protein PsYK624_028590 [Phanerochaete sordida]